MAYNNVLHLALSTKNFTVFNASILQFEITKPIQYLIYLKCRFEGMEKGKGFAIHVYLSVQLKLINSNIT